MRVHMYVCVCVCVHIRGGGQLCIGNHLQIKTGQALVFGSHKSGYIAGQVGDDRLGLTGAEFALAPGLFLS